MAITFSGIVLAGGSSNRMGMDKRFMMIHAQPLVVWVIGRLRALVDEVIVAALDPAMLDGIGARVVTDVYPGRGVLAGLHAGLAAARSEWAVAVAGDMPLLNPALLRAMMRLAEDSEADILVPQWQGNLEPLHALYRPSVCVTAAEAALQAGKRRIVASYPDVRVYIVPQNDIARWDPEGHSFFNVNTPEDWEVAMRLLEG